MIGIPLGIAASNAFEWWFHKHVLHGRKHGKDRGSFWSFHFHDHHRLSRKNGMHDPDYEETVFQWNGQGKEAAALVAGGLLWVPLLPVAPFFVGTVWACSINYYVKHRRAHLDPEWAKEHLPWHYDHHMGPDQDANWCVTRPWMDHIMGTRKPYLGTDQEKKDNDRKARKAARDAA